MINGVALGLRCWLSSVGESWLYFSLGANDQKPNPKRFSSGNLSADVVGWIVLPKNICSNPNLPKLWTQPCLEIGSLKIKVKAKSLQWVLNPMTSVLTRRGKFGCRDAQGEDTGWSHRGKKAMWWQRQRPGVMQLRSSRDYWKLPEARKRQGTVLPWSLIREHGPADTLILDFQPPGVQEN